MMTEAERSELHACSAQGWRMAAEGASVLGRLLDAKLLGVLDHLRCALLLQSKAGYARQHLAASMQDWPIVGGEREPSQLLDLPAAALRLVLLRSGSAAGMLLP